MKLNKILSSALIFVMLFAALVAVFPVNALAAEADNGVVFDMTSYPEGGPKSEETRAVVKEYLNYNFASAEDMLNYELSKNYLVSATAGNYIVYVNYYTGFMYYVNTVTGQILTSNPVDPAYQITTESSKEALMSQIELTFSENANSSSESGYNSLHWISEGAILEVSKIDGKGINVKYTIGDVSEFFVAPGVLLADTFEENICKPIFDSFAAVLEEYCGEFDPSVPAVNGAVVTLVSYNVADHADNIANFVNADDYSIPGIKRVMDQLNLYAQSVLGNKSEEYLAFNEYFSAVIPLFTEASSYSYIAQHNVDFIAESIKKEVSAIAEGKPVYKLTHNGENVDDLRAIDKALRTANPDYKKENADADERECGYNPPSLKTPLINVSLRYVLDSNGLLTVELPASPDQLVFDHANFSITSVTPLKYFGAGDMDRDGYIFYPDGSGTVVEFEDFYYGSESDKTNTSIFVSAPIYGNDYVYSTITGAHREQITMPVYGMVNDVKIGNATDGYTDATNGFFTIIESGSATADLCFESGGGTNKYAEAYSVVRPYPSDKYDLSKSLSVSGLGFYYVVAETGFEGTYKYRVNMLFDEDIAKAKNYTASKDYYVSDYVGMASCYRDYLVNNGTLTDLAEFSEDLPLYIEALGSMDIVKRILTFPVTVSTSLTTFEDVEIMYKELSDVTAAKEKFLALAVEYDKKKADKIASDPILDEDDQYLIKGYERKAAHYRDLAAKVENIRNINFRLTGFANGGMYFTYPAKVKWESSVGGKRGFKNLVAAAADVNKNENYNFGIFPDFDFLFINNTGAFDGIYSNGISARMVDNRYASKQSYDSIQQKYESLFALVVSTDSLDKLYTKFEKKYSKFDIDTLSVSTLGSTLNSNFDEDNLVNRETALGHVTGLLDRMANEDGYSLMTDAGNIYSVKYVDHILNATVDSSHFRYSSFTVPFYGMVLHGYVNYSGSPLNYSGSPDYDILRSIENGASLYYILCYENTNHLKEDEILSQYYGIDYANWQEKILEQYLTVNKAIGDLQKYKIVDHEIIIAERIIDADETKANYQRLVDEFVDKLIPTIEDCVDAANAANPGNRNGYYLNLDRASIKAKVAEILSTYDNEAERNAILASREEKIDDILDRYETLYPEKAGAVQVVVNKDSVVYVSDYSYVTDSIATDRENYKYTDFTCDNGTVVSVVYEYTDASGNTDTVEFIINYNNFKVSVNLGGQTLVLNEYGCYKLTANDTIMIK